MMYLAFIALLFVRAANAGLPWPLNPPWDQNRNENPVRLPGWIKPSTSPPPQRRSPLQELNSTTDTPRSFGGNQIWSWEDGDLPGPRTSTSYAASACANGQGSPPYSYACPHQAMLTDDMLEAARFDGLDEHFAYALAGGATDSEGGICYQVQLLDAEKDWNPEFPFLIVQLVNSGFDVMPGQLDLFMGAGGFGYFTALNADCRTDFCNGGPCGEGMYDGDFKAWNNAQYSDPHLCYSGGVKWLERTNQTYIWELCRKLSGESDQLKDRILWDSCARSNIAYFHQNFYQTRYARVQCPEGLYRISGIRRSDDVDQPLPHPENNLTLSCKGSRERGRTCISTMHDGCPPSLVWPGKVSTIEGYDRVDRCGRDGNVLSV